VTATPTLQLPPVVLRPLSLDDSASLFLAMSDPRVQKYRRQRAHAHRDQTAEYIRATLANGYGWAITEGGGEALGRIALRVPEAGLGEIGILLRASAQGRGLGAKSVAAVCGFAFGERRLERVQVDVDCENVRSLALFERAGFVRDPSQFRQVETPLGIRTMLRLVRCVSR
jgi:ribosomal-protein-alanine N-acetyltransferase